MYLNSLKITKIFIVIIVSVFIAGCATIPKQSAQLSEELGYKLNKIEHSHILLLHNFFNQKREIVDDFIVKLWIPKFSENFFSNPTIEKTWNEIVSSGNKEDRLKFITLLGPKLLSQIENKRQELIKPLDILESDIEQKILNEYNAAKSINNSLTSFLYSAAKVDENRSRYLEMIGVTDTKIGEAINNTDQIVTDLIKGGETTLDNLGKVNSYLSKLEEIKNKINNH
jgi:hypothetical protein